MNHTTYYHDRGILAPTNDNIIDKINDRILSTTHGSTHHLLLSTDKFMPDVVSVEYLKKIDVAGSPPHDLSLKVGVLVFFIRDINFDSGLVNEKRGVIRGVSHRVLDIEYYLIIDGNPFAKVPRIFFESQVGSRVITFHRYQFPIRVGYSMTNKQRKGKYRR